MKIGKGGPCHCESVKISYVYYFIYLLFSFSKDFLSLDELYMECEMCEC